MTLKNLIVTFISIAALPLAGCGGVEDEAVLEPVPEEAAASVEVTEGADDVGQAEQGIMRTFGASCGHGTFAFAQCDRVDPSTPKRGFYSVYGCKARTTGRVIWKKHAGYACSICTDLGIKVSCDR